MIASAATMKKTTLRRIMATPRCRAASGGCGLAHAARAFPERPTDPNPHAGHQQPHHRDRVRSLQSFLSHEPNSIGGQHKASHAAPRERVKEEIMSKSETMITDTGKAGEPAALTDEDLDAVSGGMDLKGASDPMNQRAKNDPAQMFQQIMQQMTQGG